MTLLGIDKVLHLYEYEDLPQELVYQKNDDELSSGTLIPAPVIYGQRQIALPFPNLIQGKLWADRPGERLSVGIGKYGTKKDGGIYMCVLLDMYDQKPVSCSYGVYYGPQLVQKALEIYFFLLEKEGLGRRKRNPILHSSRNPVFRNRTYCGILGRFPVRPSMTSPGERGGIANISTYFSCLKRRLGGCIFEDWQDAVDWLENDRERHSQPF